MRQAFCIALLCAPTLAHADLSGDLAETFAPVAHVATVADTLSCVALFRSLSLVFGPESDLFDGFQDREGYLAAIAGVLWADSAEAEGHSPDDVFAVLLPPINAATDQYLAHMDAVTLETDVPFDDQILDQVDFCNAMIAGLQQDAR